MGLPLILHDEVFGLQRLDPSVPIPPRLLKAAPVFLARTHHELSIVAPIERCSSEGRFRLIQIDAVFGDTESGILKQLIDPLAAAGVWILALCTHDTDYILVREDQLSSAIHALSLAGHGSESDFP